MASTATFLDACKRLHKPPRLPTIAIVVARVAYDQLYFEDLLQRNPEAELCKQKEEDRWTVKGELSH